MYRCCAATIVTIVTCTDICLLRIEVEGNAGRREVRHFVCHVRNVDVIGGIFSAVSVFKSLYRTELLMRHISVQRASTPASPKAAII